MNAKSMIPFRTPDGTVWGVEVAKPLGPSNALVIFHHPDPDTHRRDRYAWFNWHGSKANDVTVSLTPKEVQEALDEAALQQLFIRSMFVGPTSVRQPVIK